MTKTGHALLALVMLVPSLANPQDRLRRLTLDEAIAVATRENPTLRAKTLEVHATRANEITAALRPNPSVSYSADQLGGRTAEPQHIITLGQLIETGVNVWEMCTCSDGGDSITINWERLRTACGEGAFSARTEHLARLYLADRVP